MSQILDSALSIRLQLEGGVENNRGFRDDVGNKGHLASQLLMYDTIVIPTKDFGVLVALETWCGIEGLIELLDSGALHLLWYDLHPCYMPQGGGLQAYAVNEPHSGWENWYQVARWGGLEEAAASMVKHGLDDLKADQRQRLLHLVLQRSSNAGRVAFTDETHRDLASSPDLLAFLQEHEPQGATGVNLRALSGIEPGKVRTPSRHLRDGIDLALRIAEINFELGVSARHQWDLGTSPGTEILLANKLQRAGASSPHRENFARLLDLEGVPDIRPAVENGALPLDELVVLRSTRGAARFREWLHGTGARSPRELERAYVEAVGARAGSLPTRTIRVLATIAASAVDPVSGIVAAVGEGFFVDEWLHGYSPKLFVERMRRLPFAEGTPPAD